jgi:hypothetical protein
MKDTAMLKMPWPGAAATLTQRTKLARYSWVMLGSFLLLGCSIPRPAPPAPALAPAPGAPKPAFTVDMPLDVLTNDPDAKAVLYRDVPGVMNNPKYPLFEDMSLAQIAIVSAGRLPKEKLDEVQADFDKLSEK